MARHGVNAIWLIGRLHTTPRLRNADTRRAVATATLVTQRKEAGKHGGPVRDEHHNLRANGALAELLGQLSLGAELFVEGSLHTPQRDGQRLVDQPKCIELYALEILAEPTTGQDLDRQSSERTFRGADEPAASTAPSVHARDDAEPDRDEVSPPPTQIIRPG